MSEKGLRKGLRKPGLVGVAGGFLRYFFISLAYFHLSYPLISALLRRKELGVIYLDCFYGRNTISLYFAYQHLLTSE